MFSSNLPSGIYPPGDMTITTNDAGMHFLEYDCCGGSGIQEKKLKTWQEKTDKERDRNLRRFFGYD